MKLTLKGQIFQALASAIILQNGYDTTKTAEWRIVQFDNFDKFDISKSYDKELNWFVDNGYLFRYEIERTNHNTGHGRYHRSWKTKHVIYGLTKKAWAIVDKYVDREEMEKQRAEAKAKREAFERELAERLEREKEEEKRLARMVQLWNGKKDKV